ncbi:MAG: bifunctional folylpolyglutamate synthase/dihydrofolate synthase [Alistipes sp.]|nr:bifunctional folylpolyglutamate synthase/dihydrofolate synthase [Alistipes sp.]
MNYTETLDYLFTSLPTFQQDGALAYKPGLERVSEFCRKIGNPQRSYFVIHVAGTNGKGSVSNMLASVLQQAGYQVGLYTSPHLTDFRERIRINGEMISKQKVVNFVSKYRKDMEECELSFFEMTTAMAFDYFAQNDVEVAVIETGLGGRLDATNIVIPAVSVITNVGLEHTDLLGDSLPKIAREKGGIIKKSIPVVVGEKSSAYNLVIEDIAADRHSTVIYAEQAFECHRQQHEGAVQVFDMIRTRDNQQYTLRIPLLGEYQRQNVATVCAVADYLHENTPLSISRRAFVEGMRDTTLITGFRGRWQTLSTAPTIICDTAHNAHGIRLVAKQLEEIKQGKLYCVMGFCEDKNITEMLALMPKGAHYIFTRAESRRAATVEHISAIASALNLDFECQPTVATAVERAKSLASGDDTIFIGGSTFVVAEILP